MCAWFVTYIRVDPSTYIAALTALTVEGVWCPTQEISLSLSKQTAGPVGCPVQGAFDKRMA